MKITAEKIIKLLKENKWIHYALIIIVGIIISIPLCKIQIRDTHDGMLHVLRMIGTNDTLSLGQFPPIIEPQYCNGAGYSMNLFYPPLVTYIPLLIKLFTTTYSAALKIFAGMCIVLSGITMYQFVYRITKNRIISLFAAIIYLFAPYKLANIYKRYAIGEFTGFIFIPIVFSGLYNLFNEDGKKHYLIAIGAIGLMLSHTVTTFYTAILSVFFILFYIKKLKNKDILKKCVINILFILLCSMMFWAPLLEAQNQAEYSILDNKIMKTNNEFVSDNTIELYQLFTDKNEANGTTFLIGIPIIILLISTIYTYRKIDKKYKNIYIIFWMFSVICLFMASNFFPWRIIPNIFCKLQYPWRMIGFFVFFSTPICGINLYILLKNLLKKDILRLIIFGLFLIATIVYSISILLKYETKDYNLDSNYEANILENKKISHMRVNRDYLPVKSLLLQKTYMMQKQEKTDILKGQAQIIKEEKQNLQTKINIKDIQNGTILEFSYLFYPGYEITLNANNKTTILKPQESEHGYLSCEILEDIEEVSITVEYKGTLITRISYITSFISIILLAVYIFYENKKEKNKDKNKKKEETKINE